MVSGVAQAKTTLNVNDPAATRQTLTASGTTVKQGETLQLLTTQGDFSDGTQNDVTLVTAWLAEGDNPKQLKS